MYHHFSTEFFISNRQRLRELFVGTAPIVITANGLLQRNGDSTYNFRQDSNFWYLTGLQYPDLILVIDKDKEYLILPEQQTYQEIFHGGHDSVNIQLVSGIETICTNSEGWKRLGGRLKRVKHVATIGAAPAYIKDQGFYTNPARAALIDRLKSENDQLELLDLRPQLSRMRVIKQPAEIKALQQAIDITAKAIKQIRKKTIPV